MKEKMYLLLTLIYPLSLLAQQKITFGAGISIPQGTYEFQSGTQHEFTESAYVQSGFMVGLDYSKAIINDRLSLNVGLSFINNPVDEEKMASVLQESTPPLYSIQSNSYRHLSTLLGVRFKILVNNKKIATYIMPQFGGLITFKPDLIITESSGRGLFESNFDARRLSTVGIGGTVGLEYQLNDKYGFDLRGNYLRGVQTWEVFENSTLSNTAARKLGGVLEREIKVEILNVSIGVFHQF